MGKYTFFRSEASPTGGERDLRPIPGQTVAFSSGIEITDFKVSFKRTSANGQTEGVVEFYPEGTVFASDNVFANRANKTVFLAGVPVPVAYPAGTKTSDVPAEHPDISALPIRTRAEMQQEWNRFEAPDAAAKEPALRKRPSETVTEKPYRQSLRDSIQAQHPCPTVAKDGFYADPAKWAFIVRDIMTKRNVMLTGPSGSGKTEILMLAAAQLGIPCRIYDMGAMQDPMTQLLGTHRISGGNSVFEYSRFAEDIQKPGLVVFDEISRADPMTNNILFRLLDSRRELAVEQAGENQQRVIKAHPDCAFAATANIGDEYVGTRELDPAIRQRFLTCEMTFLPEAAEKELLQKRSGIDERAARWIVKTAGLIRERCRSHILGADTATASTRETIATADLVADGWSVPEAMAAILLPRFAEEERDTVRRLFAAG